MDTRPDAALRRMEQRYRSLVDAITAITWITPASGEFEVEQPGWSAFTGQSFAQLRGWGWLDAVHPDDRPLTARVWSAAVAGRTLYEVEHRLRRHDGVYRDMLVRAVPILDGGGIREWVGVHTDVTDQKRVERALREAKEAADAANRAKSEFLANMSHEIRTPMNGILGMTELALGTQLTRQQREYLQMVKGSAEALLTILNDILDFSKIEAGKLSLDPVDFRLRDDLCDALKAAAVRAEAKGLELSWHVDPGVPDRLRGDLGRLRQVVLNLVGNAIKFTEHGEVALHVGPAGPGEGPPPVPPGCRLHFRVTDTGVGIPAAKLGAIFQPFSQADTSTTRRYGGTGLGLTISAQLVGMMGGRVWVESEVGRGSTFHFTACLEAPAAGPEPAPPPRLAGAPVLVVDDNATNRRWLHDLLDGWGMRPALADGGPAALEALEEAARRRGPFRLVLLDMMMPGMDGLEVAERVAGNPALAGTPILMLSSAGQSGAAARSRGVTGYLTKPVKQSDLLEQILATIGPPPTPLPRPAPPPAAPGGRSLRVLLAEDNAVNQVLAAHMLRNRGHTVEVVETGRKAVDAVAASRFDVVLMDVQMPEMSGFEAVALIRERERAGGTRVPVIALTAHAMTGDRERSLAAGMDDHVTKPIQPDALWAAIDRVTAVPLPARAAGAPALPPLLQNDPTLLAELVPPFLDSSRRGLGEIRAALAAGDARRVAFAGHSLKSSVGAFGAEAAQDAARRLEELAAAGDLAGAAGVFEELERAVSELIWWAEALPAGG